MVMLALDTCLGACSAALFDLQHCKVIAERHTLMERGHAEALPPMVQALLQDAGFKARDLTRIAVTVGPGSFTGVRIGLSFARGLAVALRIPITGIDTLTATAAPLLEQGKPIVVMHHAGASGFVYTARFDRARSSPELQRPDQVKIHPGDLIIGTAAQHPHNHNLPLAHLFAPHAANLPALSSPPEPLYLREADAKPQASSRRMLENMTITTVDANSAATLAKLHALCFDHPWTEQSVGDMLSVPGTQALIAETALGHQGFVIIRAIAGEAEILSIATLPHIRQRGLGRALINAAANLLLHHATILHLEVASDNDAAIALYEKTGFIRTGLRKDYYRRTNGSVDAILMQRQLP